MRADPTMLLAWTLALGLALASQADSQQLSNWNTGVATFYGGAPDGMSPYNPSFGTSEGSCGYGVLSKTVYPFWSVGALSTSSPFYTSGPTQGCGECFQITCQNQGGQYAGRCNADPTQRSVTIMITDACPECEADHLDLQALTFSKIAPMAGGLIDIQYAQVQCTPPNPMTVLVDQNRGAGGWIRLQISQTGASGSVQAVQLKGANSNWVGMTNVWGAAWELSNAPAPPLSVHIVGDDGQEVTAFNVIGSNGQTGVLPTNVQFTFNGTSNGELPAPVMATAGSQATAVAAPGGQASAGASAAASGTGAAASASAIASASSGGTQPLVTAFNGPPQGAPPASTPSPQVNAFSGPTQGSPSPPANPGAFQQFGPNKQLPCPCSDVPPPGSSLTCQQQQSYGQCTAAFMWTYCQTSCGGCNCQPAG